MADKARPPVLTMEKRRETLNVYRARTRCGMYGGYAVVFAYNHDEAVQLVNELLADNPDCREGIGPERISLIYEDVNKLQPFAHLVWDGNL